MKRSSRFLFMLSLCIILVGVLMLPGNSFAAWVIDASYNPNVACYTNQCILTMATQTDGKVLIGGAFYVTAGGYTYNDIARLNTNGTVDTTFKPLTPDQQIDQVIVQPDGQIIIGGHFTTITDVISSVTSTRNHIARLKTDGSLDTTFNPDAENPTDIYTSSVTALALQTVVAGTPQILVGGHFTQMGGVSHPYFARLNLDGTVDGSFNPNPNNSIQYFAVQPTDQKIVVGGNFNRLNCTTYDATYACTSGGTTVNYIARLNTDGSLDTSWDYTQVGIGSDEPSNKMVLPVVQSDGTIIVYGIFASVMTGPTTTTARNNIARLTSNGSLDNTFDANANGSVWFVAPLTGGNLISTGTFTVIGGQSRNYIARVDTSGAADLTFDPNANDAVYTLAMQTDGSIIAGGAFTIIGGQARNHVARIYNNSLTATTTRVSSNLNPSPSGSMVTFTATVTPSAATGTVTFKDGTSTLGTGNLSGGKATYSTNALAIGPHSITAVYGGDTSYATSTSSAITQTVNSTSTTTGVTSSLNPSTYGNSVTFTATVTPSTATGTVTFKDGASTLGTGTLSGGMATLSTAALTAGSHSITAVYGGDSNFSSSTSSILSQTVNKVSTTTSVTSSANPLTFGNSVTFTATVTSGATGTVTFKDGASTLGTGALSSGMAIYSTTALAGGSHAITAVYGGDTNYATSTSSILSQIVNNTPTTISITSSLPTSTYGGAVTFTATVTPSAATGTVTFMDGGSSLGTGTLSGGGTATYPTSALGGGVHSITAVYGGDTYYLGSTSSPFAQTVNKANQTITFGALTVKTYGDVDFNPGATATSSLLVSYATSSTAVATIIGSNIHIAGAGTATITASQAGDNNYNAATNVTQILTVNKANQTISNLVSSLTRTYGNADYAPGAAASSGLAVSYASSDISVATIVSNQVHIVGIGTSTITASQSGNTNYNSAPSVTETLLVNPAPTSTSISAPAIAYGADGTVTVTVSSGILLPTGNVSLSVDGGTPMLGSVTGAGTATFTITNPSFGNHTLIATYTAQGNFGASSATGQLSVGGSVTTTTITSPAPITYGANGSVTVNISSGVGTPTGSVSLTVDSGAPQTVGLIPLNGTTATATFAIASPNAGSHALSASYTAQGSFGASSATGTLNVNKAVLTVTANNASKVYNTANPVFTPSYSGFVNGQTQSVLTGAPSLTTTATTASPVGTYPITAAVGSLSATNYSFTFVNGTLTVTQASTITSITSSYGNSVTFTARVTPSTVTGFVTFMDGATTLGAGILNGGTATYTTAALGGGTHSITAVYSGDANYATSTSPAITQSLTAVSSSANVSAYGNPVTFTATLTPSTATGTVTFMDGATALGTGTLSGGTATFNTSALTDGSHTITAVYGGNANLVVSSSSALSQTVVMADGILNGSGTVDMTDALKALRIAAGIDTPSASDLDHLDVAPLANGQRNPDGKVDLCDVVAILKKAADPLSW